MLSLSNVGRGEIAASYYEAIDDYYTIGQSPSAWWGTGANSLNLQGAVDPNMFAALLDGHLPGGETLHRAAAGRRGGTDATFSAPKSVSLMALVGNDRRLINAHRLAVDRALTYAEGLAACRVTNNGVTSVEQTENLVVARFDHDLSRAADPQLHTHCVLINVTRRSDGYWRAMDNQSIYRHKMLLGALYRSELARELQKLGYRVRVTHGDGRFELAHFNDNQIKAFSKRSAAIEEYLKVHYGLDRSEVKGWDKRLAAVITREKKTDIDRKTLQQEWLKLSMEHGINYSIPMVSQPQIEYKISQAVENAIDHISERRSVFSEQCLVQAALERSVGIATLSEIKVELRESIRCGSLINEGKRYTTPLAQKLERDILHLEEIGRGKFESIYKFKRENLLTQLTKLTTGQRDAVLGILLTGNQTIGIQGRAGAGKTTLLSTVAEHAIACGYTVKGLAPSIAASRQLAEAGIDSETIAAFMLTKSKQINSRTLLIVDEAGMTSTRQMHSILSEASIVGCRIVLVGDTSQLQSVEAGKPFAQLQANGMHTAVVNQIQRQKNITLKNAVEMTINGQVAMAVELLNKQIVEIENTSERFTQIANDYIALSTSERKMTRVIAGTRHARSEINCRIRDKLGLTKGNHEFTLLERKDLTRSQAHSILSYEVGDIVLAESDYPSLRLRRGQMATVIERLPSAIMLELDNGLRVTWRPALANKLTAYIPVKRNIAIGDILRATSNDRTRGLVNGDIGEVNRVDREKQILVLTMQNGQQITLDSRRPLALDYGYCTTVYGSQGQTCDRVLIEADSHSLTSNENTFYVAISRAKHHVHIYTDDREYLPIAMSREIDNEAALELQADSLEII